MVPISWWSRMLIDSPFVLCTWVTWLSGAVMNSTYVSHISHEPIWIKKGHRCGWFSALYLHPARLGCGEQLFLAETEDCDQPVPLRMFCSNFDIRDQEKAFENDNLRILDRIPIRSGPACLILTMGTRRKSSPLLSREEMTFTHLQQLLLMFLNVKDGCGGTSRFA